MPLVFLDIEVAIVLLDSFDISEVCLKLLAYRGDFCGRKSLIVNSINNSLLCVIVKVVILK